MRIAYVCSDPGVPVFGRKGCSVHVQEVIAAFLRRGDDVELFATRFDGVPLVESLRLRLHRLPAISKGDLAAREREMQRADAALARALRKQGPFDLVCQRYSLWSCAGMEMARELQTPGLLEVNAPLVKEQARHRDLIDRRAAEHISERAFSASAALLAVSEPLAAWLNAQPSAQGRVHVVHNGVNADRISPLAAAKLPSSGGLVTVGFVGSMKPWHDLATLIAAVHQLHVRDLPVRLLLIGDGPQREVVLREIAALGMDHAVVAPGAVDPAEIPSWLASMDVAVAPYPSLTDFYFSPLKLLEYMAAGLPVVTSRIDALSDLVSDGVTGLEYEPGEPASLAERLERLCADSGLRARLGQAARDWVIQRHSWDAVVQRIVDLAAGEPPRVDACLEVASQ